MVRVTLTPDTPVNQPDWAIDELHKLHATGQLAALSPSMLVAPGGNHYQRRKPSTHEPREMMALDAAKVLESTVNEAFGTDTPPVPVRAHLVEGKPADVRREASIGANLLVLGAHGGVGDWSSIGLAVLREPLAQ